MRWFRRQARFTAEAARKITGISIPFGGLQWADPGPSERELVRQFVVFLEDRRVLYNAMDLEVVSQVHHSIQEIRGECTSTLQKLPAKAFAVSPIRLVRAAARQFQTDQNEEFRFFDHRHHDQGGPGFFAALGALRATVGLQVMMLAAQYDLDVEGDLAAIMLQPDNPNDDGDRAD